MSTQPSNNIAEWVGGGIVTNAFSSLTVTNSTLSFNEAVYGAGIYSGDYNGTTTTTTISNSIIAYNTSIDCSYGALLPNIAYSLIKDGSCGVINGVDGNLTDDPNLGIVVGIPAYFPLLPGSIAINAGSNALIPVGVTTDQAGNPRIQCGVVDMGSFESGMSPTPTPPAPDVNLITNGTFANGLNGWNFSQTTQQISNGALQIAPNTPGSSFYQFVNFNSAGEIFEVNFRAANSSGTVKTLNLMVRDSDWSPLYNCVFGIAAYAPFQNFRMRFDTSEGFIPMVLQGALSGDSTMGLLIDDITMVRKTGLTVPTSECSVAPPPNTDLIYDGAFNQGTANWAAFNAAMQVVNIGGSNGNVMELARWNGTPNGGFYQYNPYSTPANGVLQFNFQIGNQSNVARVINMLVRNPDWTDLHSCFITVPANTPLTSLQIKLKTSLAWSNIVIQGWIQVGDYTGAPPLPFRFDNLSLQYLPAGTSGTTECPSPIPMPQRPTWTPSLIASPTATATATLTPSPSPTDAGEGSATPSATATLTETPTATVELPTSTPSETATDMPTMTPEPPTATEVPSETPSPPTPVPQGEGSPTPEPSPEVTQIS